MKSHKDRKSDRISPRATVSVGEALGALVVLALFAAFLAPAAPGEQRAKRKLVPRAPKLASPVPAAAKGVLKRREREERPKRRLLLPIVAGALALAVALLAGGISVARHRCAMGATVAGAHGAAASSP